MSQFPAAITRTLKEDGDDFLNAAIRKWKFNKRFKRNLITFIILGKIEKSCLHNKNFYYYENEKRYLFSDVWNIIFDIQSQDSVGFTQI